jgi:superfamily II DNA helicase RecQ
VDILACSEEDVFSIMASTVSNQNLRDLLRKVFGFDDFRPSQEAVCQAVASGQDVLLVMPTGAEPLL